MKKILITLTSILLFTYFAKSQDSPIGDTLRIKLNSFQRERFYSYLGEIQTFESENDSMFLKIYKETMAAVQLATDRDSMREALVKYTDILSALTESSMVSIRDTLIMKEVKLNAILAITEENLRKQQEKVLSIAKDAEWKHSQVSQKKKEFYKWLLPKGHNEDLDNTQVFKVTTKKDELLKLFEFRFD